MLHKKEVLGMMSDLGYTEMKYRRNETSANEVKRLSEFMYNVVGGAVYKFLDELILLTDNHIRIFSKE